MPKESLAYHPQWSLLVAQGARSEQQTWSAASKSKLKETSRQREMRLDKLEMILKIQSDR